MDKVQNKTNSGNQEPVFLFSSRLSRSNICAITIRLITTTGRTQNNLLRPILVENGNSRSVFFYRSLSYEVRFFKYRDITHSIYIKINHKINWIEFFCSYVSSIQSTVCNWINGHGISQTVKKVKIKRREWMKKFNWFFTISFFPLRALSSKAHLVSTTFFLLSDAEKGTKFSRKVPKKSSQEKFNDWFLLRSLEKINRIIFNIVSNKEESSKKATEEEKKDFFLLFFKFLTLGMLLQLLWLSVSTLSLSLHFFSRAWTSLCSSAGKGPIVETG